MRQRRSGRAGSATGRRKPQTDHPSQSLARRRPPSNGQRIARSGTGAGVKIDRRPWLGIGSITGAFIILANSVSEGGVPPGDPAAQHRPPKHRLPVAKDFDSGVEVRGGLLAGHPSPSAATPASTGSIPSTGEQHV
jgi:hypothetical protein